MSHLTPTTQKIAPGFPLSGSLRVGLLFCVGIVAASCDGPAPTTTGTRSDAGESRMDAGMMSCAQPDEGCACDATAPVRCYLEPTPTASTAQITCHRGTRYCRSGVWSACESIEDYTIDSPASALITGPSAPNPCDPLTFVTTLNPTPSDLTPSTSTNTTYTPGSPTSPSGITLTSTTSLSRPAPCTPIAACPVGFACGTLADGCGGTITCGTCGAGLTCGGGGVAYQCGSPATSCVPHGCGTANCGSVGDGCGGLTASCGTCTYPNVCGSGGTPSRCGGPPIPPCVGPGGVGTGLCTRIPTCAGGGTSTIRGVVTAPGHADPVTPACSAYGDDPSCTGAGCSWTPACSDYASSGACTGAGCSWSSGGSCSSYGSRGSCRAAGCSWFLGLCFGTPSGSCSGSVASGCSGTPTPIPNPWGEPDPLYDVQVYVPGTTPAAFTPGVSCDRCTATPSGNPIAQTRSDIDGNFTLTGVPCGTNIPLVIQLGRWRRQITIPNVACCGTTTLTDEQVRMPRNHTEGDIPLIAMVTGDVDAMECILRKIGIDDSEFSNPAAQGGSGRVRIYQNYDPTNGWNGAEYNASTPQDTQLLQAGGDLNQYDMAFFACPGYAYDQPTADLQRLIDYANIGGRIFATHFHYDYLNNNPFATNPAAPATMAAWSTAAPAPFSQTANWSVNTSSRSSTTATIDTGFTRGAALAQWLFNRGASTTYGQIPVSTIRQDFTSVVAPAQRWLYDSQQPIHYTFDTPITYAPLGATPAANQCGRVVFSDWHAAPSGGITNWDFPSECDVGPMTPQERVLEFMLFDLAACIPVPTAPPCVPMTCASQGLSCGMAADGCGGTLNCGPCPMGTSCGGGGTPGMCGAPMTCVPLTCASPAAACGVSSDGCGGSISCPCTSFAPSGTFTELFASQPMPCTITECPVWGTFNFTADVPAGTRIVFSFQSADTAAGFPSLPTATYTVNPPAVGTNVTGSIDVAALMAAAGAPSGRYFMQLVTTLYSDASHTRAPTLISDNLAFTCAPCS